MNSEEYGIHVWRAGELVPAGTYLRVDDHTYRRLILAQPGKLPASYDGHVALYCQAPLVCPMSVQADASAAFNQEQGNQAK